MPTKTLTTNDVANNLTETTAGKVLDARQGKVLSDGKVSNYTGETYTVRFLTQTDYDAIGAKDANTLYFIPEA